MLKRMCRVHMRRSLVLSAALLIAVGCYWVAVGCLTGKTPNYMTTEAQTVYDLKPWQLLGPIEIKSSAGEWASYTLFAPMGFNLVATIDRFVLAPIVLGRHFDAKQFSSCPRLLYVHAFLIGLSTLALFWLLRHTFALNAGILAAVIYFGMNDGFLHALYFVATIGLYTQILGAILSVAGMAHVLQHGPSRAAHLVVGTGIALAVLAHGQSAALPLAIAAAATIASWQWRIPYAQWRVAGHYLPLAGLALYFAMRFGTGVSETSRVSESQYVFSYPSKLLMLEDMIVNVTHHIANVIDSLIMPWPMFSVSIMLKLDMNTLNQYNLTYSKWPNMQYRLLGIWYVGLLFGLAIWGSVQVARRLLHARREPEAIVALLGFTLLWLGFVMHIPVMHRDYFEQPGFNVGYKAVLSMLGLALMIPFMWREGIAPRLVGLSPNLRLGVAVGLCAWLVLCAIGKVALQPPYYYPW
jgi:hypothetical protein